MAGLIREEIVEVKNLSKTFVKGSKSVIALKDISLTAQKGEIFAILGTNGAGKTTLVKILLNFIFPDSGSAKIFGIPAHDYRSRERLGYVPEVSDLPDFPNARVFLEFFGRLSGIKSHHLRSRIDILLKQAELDNVKHAIKKYSKGMKRRLSLAQALLKEPELLILDEPTDGLDPIERERVLNLLKDYRNAGGTILICSHILSEIEALCNRYAIIKNGKILHIGTNKEFISDGYRIKIKATRDINLEAIKNKISIGNLIKNKEDGAVIVVKKETDLSQVLLQLEQLKISVEKVEQNRLTLNDLFIKYASEK